jgi:ATP-dependent RNA helicase RhlB
MTQAEPHPPLASFEQLALADPLTENLHNLGFFQCTPIQSKTLPLLLKGQDVAGRAQTGTGKTAAFLVGLYHQLLTQPEKPNRAKNQPRALILAPSRELAIQIHKDAEGIGANTPLRLCLAYGGEDYNKQRQQLIDGVDILIGTPGRIIDYHKQHVFDLKAIDMFVLDEADRMFDMGFIKDIRYLMRRMPDPVDRQSLLFSATLSLRVTELAYEHMNSPITVEIEPEQMTADKVEQTLYHVSTDDKIPLLIQILNQEQPERCMIFLNTKRESERLVDALEANNFHSGLMTGDVQQRKRVKLLEQFKQGQLPILVATDVAARGLHVTGLSHVINFDLPQDGEDYVHRIGRTARAGASGKAISLACERYVYSLMDIEEYLSQKIPSATYDPDSLPQVQKPQRARRRPPTGSNAPNKSASKSSRSGSERAKKVRSESKSATNQIVKTQAVATPTVAVKPIASPNTKAAEEIPALFGGRPWENNS